LGAGNLAATDLTGGIIKFIKGEYYYNVLNTLFTILLLLPPPSDTTILEDAGIEPKKIATLALTVTL
jgi:hypothetical protein